MLLYQPHTLTKDTTGLLGNLLVSYVSRASSFVSVCLSNFDQTTQPQLRTATLHFFNFTS